MTSAAETVSAETQVARELAAALKRNGVPYLFGIPGGGSSIDLIEACHAEQIPFVLVQHETTAAMMAVVCGQLTGSCGACISIMGPGAINLAGGATYAFLERHPLLCITETYGRSDAPLTSMQKIDHGATFAPYSKAAITLGMDHPGRQIDQAVRLAMTERPGPIHVDYPQSMDGGPPGSMFDGATEPASRPGGDLDAIANELDRAQKPLIVAGPVVQREHAQAGLLRLAERLGCAVMVTSKARGVISEDHPHYAGIISGVYGEKTLEGRMVYKSDVILGVGLDRMELLTPWKHRQPLLALDAIRVSQDDAVGDPSLTAWGHLPGLLDSLADTTRGRQTWQTSELRDFWVEAMDELGAASTELNAANALVHARKMSPRDTIVTTEAGVYGRVNLYAWDVYEENTYFDSSGANTMGYSIPAALATTLVRPKRKTVCLVGDAGFLMRAGELETAARLKLTPVIVIFNDGTLGMIRIKQRSKGYAREGVDLEQTDFVKLTESFGGVGWRVETLDQFDHAFATALESDRLHVIDVRVDADVYASQIRPIRGI